MLRVNYISDTKKKLLFASGILSAVIFISYLASVILNDKIVDKYYYPNGNIQVEEYYESLDTGSLNRVLEYFENGKLKKDFHFKNGKKQGKCISYNSLGARIRYAEYIDDLPHGRIIWYDSSGRKQAQGRFIRGISCGSLIFYDKRENRWRYNSVGFNGQAFFEAHYDKSANVNFEDGKLFDSCILLSSKKTYKVSCNGIDSIPVSTFDNIFFALADPDHYTSATVEVSGNNEVRNIKLKIKDGLGQLRLNGKQFRGYFKFKVTVFREKFPLKEFSFTRELYFY